MTEGMRDIVSGHGILAFEDADTRPGHDFERYSAHAAWYCENRQGPRSRVLGVRLDEDQSYEFGGRRHVLPAGSMLMKRPDGKVFGVGARELAESFSRSFSDGTALCRLADGPLEQALSLKNANRDLSEQIARLENVSLFRTLFRGAEVKKRTAEVIAKNAELQAHILDLTRRPLAPRT